VIAGHKRPGKDDSPKVIEATRQYIRDFDRAAGTATTARALYDKMLELYPDRVNPGEGSGFRRAASNRDLTRANVLSDWLLPNALAMTVTLLVKSRLPGTLNIEVDFVAIARPCLEFGDTTTSVLPDATRVARAHLSAAIWNDFLSVQLSSVARPKSAHGEEPKNPCCAKGTARSWCPRVGG
jgi:hypothetical protein